MKLKVSLADLLLILLWFTIFQFYTPNPEFYYIYQGFVSVIILIILRNEVFRIKYILYIILFSLTVFVSCCVNRNSIGTVHFLRGIIYSIEIVNIFLVIHYYLRVNGNKRMFGLLFRLSALYYVINSVQIICVSLLEKTAEFLKDEKFFSRGKFSLSYTIIFFLVFFLLKWNGNKYMSSRLKKTIFVSLCICSMILCSIIESTVGIVAIFIFMILICVPKKINEFIDNKFLLTMSIIFTTVIIFSINILLEIPMVQNIIVNILHENLSLTGRTELYALLYPLLLKSGLWGSGYGSYVATQLAYHGWYNAQNGFAEIILAYGYVGAVTFCLLVYKCASHRHKVVVPLVALIFTFIIISIVEIPFSAMFIFLLAIYTETDIEYM